LFELGIRTALNKPVALIKDEHTSFIFDTGIINTRTYKSTLHGRDLPEEVSALATHIRDSARSCNGSNPLWRHLGLIQRAQLASVEGSPADARAELMARKMDKILELAGQMVDSSDDASVSETHRIGVNLNSPTWIGWVVGHPDKDDATLEADALQRKIARWDMAANRFLGLLRAADARLGVAYGVFRFGSPTMVGIVDSEVSDRLRSELAEMAEGFGFAAKTAPK
jgi:hypothetical protein